MFWTTWKIVHLVIERFEIQSAINLGIVSIDNVAYEQLNNVSVYDIIRDKMVENNDILSIILNKMSQFIAIK